MTRRAEIRPGVLCMLVGLRDNAKLNGSVVTALSYVGNFYLDDETVVWHVERAWLVRTTDGEEGYVDARHLFPLNDPDADLTESTDDESRLHDNLVHALTLARAV